MRIKHEFVPKSRLQNMRCTYISYATVGKILGLLHWFLYHHPWVYTFENLLMSIS